MQIPKFSTKEPRFITVLFLFAGIIALAGCGETDPLKIALKSKDPLKGKEALLQLSEKEALLAVACQARAWQVRLAAVGMLDDGQTLARVALYEKNQDVRLAALDRIQDQSLLAEIALFPGLNDPNNLCECAVGRLTDINELAMVAVRSSHTKECRSLAVSKLYDIVAQADTTILGGRNRNYKILIESLDSVPIEHRERLLQDLLPAVQAISGPGTLASFGPVEFFQTKQKRFRKPYYDRANSAWIRGWKPGEKIECDVAFRGTNLRLHAAWSPDFPDEVSPTKEGLAFEPAKIEVVDLLEKLLTSSSDEVLMDVAMESKNFNIFSAALDQLDDQRLFERLFWTSDFGRTVLIRKITDQSVFAKIATDCKDPIFRKEATGKVTDQSLLAKIAVSDEDYLVRIFATRNLTDMEPLERISKTDRSRIVRMRAAERLAELR